MFLHTQETKLEITTHDYFTKRTKLMYSSIYTVLTVQGGSYFYLKTIFFYFFKLKRNKNININYAYLLLKRLTHKLHLEFSFSVK
jgi:hypothetical protein